jgi:hypothetical protein
MTREILCEECQNGLLAFLDGRLSSSDALSFERHCTECSSCRILRLAFLTERTVLKGLESPYEKTGAGFTAAVLKRIEKENDSDPGRYAFPVLALASVLCVLMIFGVPDQQGGEKPIQSSLNPLYSVNLSLPGSVDSSPFFTSTESTSDLFYKLSCRKLRPNQQEAR